MKIVDPHVHFYDMEHPDLVYGHWQPGVPHPSLGWQIQKLAERNYLAEDYIEETKNIGVSKTVHVQAAIGSSDPVIETRWLQEAADRTGFPNGIIAYADLRNPKVETVLLEHLEYPNMRGVRDFSYDDYLESSDFERGFSLLGKYELLSCMGVSWPEFDKLIRLAKKYPKNQIIVDHTGLPERRDAEYFKEWSYAIQKIGQVENIHCKISGLGMSDHDWTVDSIRPYVLHCIESFGVDRSFFASNWPVDWLWSSFDNLIKAYRSIVSKCSLVDQEKLFSKNAETLHRI